MPLDAKLVGIDDLLKVMRKLPDRVERKVLGSATSAAATVVRNEMQLQAPVLSGRLRARVRTKRARKSEAPPQGVRYDVGPTRAVFYGTIIEIGSATQPARPWMRPAYEASKNRAIQKFIERGGKAIVREAAKLRGPLKTSGLLSRRRR